MPRVEDDSFALKFQIDRFEFLISNTIAIILRFVKLIKIDKGKAELHGQRLKDADEARRGCEDNSGITVCDRIGELIPWVSRACNGKRDKR